MYILVFIKRMPENPPPPPPPPGTGPPKFEVKAQDRIHTTFEPTDQGFLNFYLPIYQISFIMYGLIFDK